MGGYHDLVSAYVDGNARHLAKLLAEMTGTLRADGNWGLARRLEGRLAYRAVRRVAAVYSVVGADVLEKKLQAGVDVNVAPGDGDDGGGAVGRRGTEDLLTGMALGDAGDALLADPFVVRLDHAAGAVSFVAPRDAASADDDDPSWEVDLSRRLASCVALAERVRDLDIGLATSHKYRQHAKKDAMMRGDARASAAAMKLQPRGGGGGGSGTSVADIGQGPMDLGVDW